MLVVHNINPSKKMLIYDLCSAPGGKASHVIQLTNGQAYLVGVDISLHRLKIEKKILNKLSNSFFKGDLLLGDATVNMLVDQRADRVIVDPDCSALGKLGHSPEIRLWINEDHIKQYANLQYKLLKNACRLVKRGGLIAYSTCTLTLEENEKIVKRIIEEEGLDIVKPLVNVEEEGISLSNARRLYPHKHETQGYFYVLLKK